MDALPGTIGTAAASPGNEAPGALSDEVPMVTRSFAFIDLCGFTRFTETRGEYAAIEVLASFRSLVRDLAARRDVMIGKWLGDGAMIVGGEIAPTIAMVAELLARHQDQPLAARAGVARGPVLIVDGDDYVGRPANLASRLCQASLPGELLTVDLPPEALPVWTRVLGTRQLSVPGLGELDRVQEVGIIADVALPALRGGFSETRQRLSAVALSPDP